MNPADGTRTWTWRCVLSLSDACGWVPTRPRISPIVSAPVCSRFIYIEQGDTHRRRDVPPHETRIQSHASRPHCTCHLADVHGPETLRPAFGRRSWHPNKRPGLSTCVRVDRGLVHVPAHLETQGATTSNGDRRRTGPRTVLGPARVRCNKGSGSPDHPETQGVTTTSNGDRHCYVSHSRVAPRARESDLTCAIDPPPQCSTFSRAVIATSRVPSTPPCAVFHGLNFVFVFVARHRRHTR